MKKDIAIGIGGTVLMLIILGIFYLVAWCLDQVLYPFCTVTCEDHYNVTEIGDLTITRYNDYYNVKYYDRVNKTTSSTIVQGSIDSLDVSSMIKAGTNSSTGSVYLPKGCLNQLEYQEFLMNYLVTSCAVIAMRETDKYTLHGGRVHTIKESELENLIKVKVDR